LLIEKRLEGMANRQEEFMEKLETVIRGNWLKFLVMHSVEEFPHFRVKKGLDMSKPLENLEVQKKEDSLLIILGGRKASVIAEKNNKNLIIVSDGFKLTEGRKILTNIAFGVFLLMPISVIILLSLLRFIRPELFSGPPEWDKVILLFLVLQGFMTLLVMFLRGTERKAIKIQTQILMSCIEETINMFK
jgi:hypothetical protein